MEDIINMTNVFNTSDILIIIGWIITITLAIVGWAVTYLIFIRQMRFDIAVIKLHILDVAA